MKYLFVHQNFPGQFKFLAPALVAEGHEVRAFKLETGPSATWEGVKIVRYMPARSTSPTVHPWAMDFETKVIRGEATFRAALKLREEGYAPDAIIAHPGWGESLFLKDIWPEARLGIYCEFFYRREGADVDFDPEFPVTDEGEVCRLRLKNLNSLLHFEVADAGISPTHWQASTFPEPFRSKITVVHDGIDTAMVAPDPGASLQLKTAQGVDLRLGRDDEVITFVNRELEPYRGYHIFMRALTELLRRRPKVRVLIIGGNGVSYGSQPPAGQTWKEIFAAEARARVTDEQWARVHFLGKVPYAHFLTVLRVSTVHVYLTYPFVLGWSLLEAMSTGCAIVASDTAPLREAIRHDETGRLVPFLEPAKVAAEVIGLLDDPAARARLGRQAREYAVRNYDLRSICLPRQLRWVEDLARRREIDPEHCASKSASS